MRVPRLFPFYPKYEDIYLKVTNYVRSTASWMRTRVSRLGVLEVIFEWARTSVLLGRVVSVVWDKELRSAPTFWAGDPGGRQLSGIYDRQRF
jgi:hypothetical protein